MSLHSLLAKLQDKWSYRSATRRPARRQPIRRQPLMLEALETRDLMSVSHPSILSVNPPDGTSVNGTSNVIVVQYNEAMSSDAATKGNYLLFGPSGTPVTINSVTPDAVLTNAYDISYGSGTPVAGAYTLFVKGDMVHDTNNVALAQPGQLVVANNSGTVSTVGVPDGGPNVNALQVYGLGQGINNFGGPPTPNAIALGDFNGDGHLDLAVSETNFFGSEVDIYKGNASGGFDATPAVQLPLATGANSAAGPIVAFSPFGSSSFQDIAVVDPSTGNVNVFVNQQTAGSFSFANAFSYASGAGKAVAMVAGDFNNDGVTDLAVADANADSNGNINVDILPGAFSATFGAAVATKVGDNKGNGLQNPTSLAAGALKGTIATGLTDLAEGGSNGVVTLLNPGNNSLNFTVSGVIADATGFSGGVTSVAIGKINSTSGYNDIVASSSASSSIEILHNPADNSGAFTAANSTVVSLGVNGGVVGLSNLSGHAGKLADIVVSNATAGEVTVLQNNTGYAFAAPAPYAVDTNPIALAIGAVNGDTQPDIITLSATGQTGTFSVLRNAGNVTGGTTGTFLVSSPQTSASSPDAIAVGDLNGDGIPDLVVADFGNNKVSVYLGNGSGGYNTFIYSTLDANGKGIGPDSVTLADLTGTGKLDIITANKSDSTVSILANNGSGVFAQATTVAVGSTPTQVVAGNFFNSGHVDLAVSHNGAGSSLSARGVTLLQGNGDRTFAPAVELAVASNLEATALVAGHFTSKSPTAPLDLAVTDDNAGTVTLFQNATTVGGALTLNTVGSYLVGAHPTALAAADFNRDGFQDVVAVSGDSTGNAQQISVLLNSAGAGFSPAITTALPYGYPVSSVAVDDIYDTGFPDLVVGLAGGAPETAPADANFFVLKGNGDGTFGNPVPYQAGGHASNTVVAVASDSLVRATTFTVASNLVSVDLIKNGGFEAPDLSNQRGNLLGWQTAQTANSRGAWESQTGSTSPLSQTNVPAPTPPQGSFTQSTYRAMLDESNLQPLGLSGNFNSASSYSGSNFLYQLVTLPTQATALNFSLDLYLNSAAPFTSGNSSLIWNNPAGTPDQQVRIDVMDPNAPGFAITDVEASGKGDILQNIFQTQGGNNPTPQKLSTTVTANLNSLLAQYGGKQVLIRIAAVNNQGKLIVGVDNVSLKTTYNDTTPPSFVSLPALRNPGYLSGSGPQYATTTDPTLVGQVADDGGVNNIAYVAFSPTNDGTFNKPGDFRIGINSLDPTGRFSVSIPNLAYGLNTVGVEVVDKAGNVFVGTSITFIYQGPSNTNWQAVGPGPINVTSTGVQFSTVSGRINSVFVDPTDPTGNTYFIGSNNGGVWKTTDGGADWTPSTYYQNDTNTNAPINVPVGALAGAVDPTSGRLFMYAGLGDSNPSPDSRGGAGVLFSSNGGNSWTISGDSDVSLAGARISKIVVDPTNPSVAYAAVASGGASGPGVYKLTNGKWVNILTPANMGLPNGTALASVTDLILDPYDATNLTIGLGNIGLVTASATAGVWTTANSGGSWNPVTGGRAGIQNDTLPSGVNVGRVSLAQGTGVTNDISTLYVLIASPPNNPPIVGGGVNFGNATAGSNSETGVDGDGTDPNTPSITGLYKSGGPTLGITAFTHVMIREQAGGPNKYISSFYNINFSGGDGSNSGALIVDPTDPNVVYIGASEEYPSGFLNHGLLRVDTGNMYDAVTLDSSGAGEGYVNNGDDITKRNAAYEGGSDGDFDYEIGKSNSQPYYGEGVAWYDVTRNAFGGAFTFGGNRIEPNITSVAFDSLGRLVFGTEQGAFRLEYHGAGYDYSSGGGGVLALEQSAVAPKASIQISAINGNLQDADLTSVAIDPSAPGRFYTTQFNTGAAGTSGGLNYTTLGLRGPFQAPDGDRVVVGAPDPTAPAGNLNTVYVEYAFGGANTLVSYQPQASAQGGAAGTVINLPTAGFNDRNAGYMPVLQVFPTKILDNSTHQYEDELLFGSDRIYETRTGSSQWNYLGVGAPHAIQAGAYITAANFAPSNDQVIYVGTNLGAVFVTTSAGADNFPEKDTGLPKNGPINGITVDPNNPMVAYVTVGGASGGIFKTTNGGGSWVNITGNLTGLTLTDVVDDPRSQAQSGAPNGRLYVGTNVGVYVTVNGGTSWQVFGVGLPHVPVVDLEFNQSLEELVAGTQGGGAFLISTDHTGPHAVSVTPASPVNPLATPYGQGPLSSVTVTFNEAIGSFPLSAVDSIIGPGGQTIKPISVTDVSAPVAGNPTPHTTWKISFAPQTADGIYTITIGPGVTDLVGNPMDQNQNGVNGEDPADRFTFTVVLNSTDNGQFVGGITNDLLGVGGDSTAAFEYLINPLNNATFALISQYATGYVEAYRGELVQQLYQSNSPFSIIGVGNLLGRAPTTGANGELTYYLNQLQQGLSYEQIIANITSSTEYFTAGKAGDGTDATFITNAFSDILHRAPTTTGTNEQGAWTTALSTAEELARQTDAATLMDGTTYETDFINAQFQTYLNRAPSSGPNGDLANWLNMFSKAQGANRATQEQLTAALLGTAEYFQVDAPRIVGGGATPSNDTWVKAVFQQLFPGFTLSNSDEQTLVSALNSGETTQQLAGALLVSDLYRLGSDANHPPQAGFHGFIDRTYNTLLGRFATPAELAFWQATYKTYPNLRTEDSLYAYILAVNGPGNATTVAAQDQKFANLLYSDMLDSGGPLTAQDMNNINTVDLPFLQGQETIARYGQVIGLLGSKEYQDILADTVIGEYLGRAPSAQDFAFFEANVGKTGVPGGPNGDEKVLAAALGSGEYFFKQSDPTTHLHTTDAWLKSLYPALHVPLNSAEETANLQTILADYAPQRYSDVQAIVVGPQYLTTFINAEFQTFLNRAPSGGATGDLATWLAKFQATTNRATQEQLIAALAGTQEFYNRAPSILGLNTAPSNDTWVKAVFQLLFPGFTLNASDEQSLVNALNSETTQQLATSLLSSDLYRFGSDANHPPQAGFHGLIDRLYFQYLRRYATTTEIAYWKNVYDNPNFANYNPNIRTEDVITNLLASQEYFLNVKHQLP